MNPAVGIFDRWKAIFDYGLANETGACYVVTTHPQTIGRAHMISRLEELIEYIADKGAWFATLGEIYDATDIPK
jgi:peptidoglycan/xylan/chitin deacetylase (PgdA/CDA1 family)